MKLSKDIIIVLAKYYSHRHASNSIDFIMWNKEEDLDNIAKVAAKHNFSITASAGTFWFVRNNKIYEVHELNYTD